MPITSVADLVALFQEWPLLEPAQLSEVVGVLQQRFPEPQALARELLRRDWLTAYQVNQLFQGHSEELLLGPYLLLERLGEGGMGQVFKARHQKLRRVVALKVIRKERLGNPDVVRRFQREIQAVAKLDHDNVVRAYDADQAGDIQFLVMEYMDGIDLKTLVTRSGPLPVATACDYVRQAALGLQHAHERGLVHRDVKPSNFLLASSESVIKVLDLGLARVDQQTGADASSVLTREGTLMGTWDYMAPEQVTCAHAVDGRADLYSLGCTLYFLLTARVPFPGGTSLDKLDRHRAVEPEPVDKFRAGVPAAVAQVVRRLLAKRPEDRYASAAELAAALEELLARGIEEAGPARPPSVPAPRDPFAELGLTDTAQSAGSTPRPTQPLRGSRRQWLLGMGGIFVAQDVTAVAFSPDGKILASGGRDAAVRLWDVATWMERKERPGPVHGELVGVVFSPDGKLLAFAGNAGGGVRLWDLARKKERLLLQGHQQHIQALAFAPAGLTLATGSRDGNLVLWDLGGDRPAKPVFLERNAGAVKAVAFSRNGKRLAAVLAGQKNTVRLWDVAVQRRLAIWPTDQVFALVFAADGATLATGEGGRSLLVREVPTGKTRALRDEHAGMIFSLALAPDGKALVSGSFDGTVRLWDLAGPTPRPHFSPRGPVYRVDAAEFAPDGKSLALASQAERGMRWWDVLAATSAQRLPQFPQKAPVMQLAFSPDGRTLAVGDSAGTTRLWDLRETVPRPRSDLDGRKGQVLALAFSPDSRLLACCQHQGTKVWDLSGPRPRVMATPQRAGTLMLTVAFSPDGQTVAIGSQDYHDNLHLWQRHGNAWKEQPLLAGHTNSVLSVAFSPDGLTLASGGGRTVWLWDLSGTRPVGHELKVPSRPTQPTHPDHVLAVAFSPDGKLLASADRGGLVMVWSASGKLLRKCRLPGPVWHLSFASDSRHLATANNNATVYILRVMAPPR